MSTRTTGKRVRRFRFWPGIVFPAGLTLLLALAGWQFAVGVTAEQERRNDADAALASYARMEAGELSRRAHAAAQAFVDGRLAARAEQEKNLRVEIRGVMEAVNRVLGASLDKNRDRGADRREVGSFPSGFESVKKYLELSRSGGDGDAAVKALHACAPELGGLLPAGCSLAVVENNAVEIFAVGGGAPPEGGVSVAMNREFIWSDGAEVGKHWTLQLSLHAPDLHPLPAPEEIAAQLTNELSAVALDNARWSGWLVASGRPVAGFPAGGGGVVRPGEEPPVFTGVAGEWVEGGAESLVWLESAGRLSGLEDPGVSSAVAAAIMRPGPPLDLVGEFLADTRWICTLGALALGALAFWVWFVRNILSSGRRRIAELEEEVDAVPVPAASRRRAGAGQGASARVSSVSAGASSAGAGAVAAELQRRLVRDAAVRSPAADAGGVIVADIAGDGGMALSNVPNLSDALRRPVTLPSGSLFRLQARHRGGKGRAGARALDRATHPVLRTLAARIRPVANAPAAAQNSHNKVS